MVQGFYTSKGLIAQVEYSNHGYYYYDKISDSGVCSMVRELRKKFWMEKCFSAVKKVINIASRVTKNSRGFDKMKSRVFTGNSEDSCPVLPSETQSIICVY